MENWNSNNIMGTSLIILIVTVVIFLLCRELMCWYWKINKSLSNQETIIQLLQQIANQTKDVKEIKSLNKNDFIQLIGKRVSIVLGDGTEIVGTTKNVSLEGYLILQTDYYGDKEIKPENIKTINTI